MNRAAAMTPGFAWRAQLAAAIGWLERLPLSLLQLAFRVSLAAVFWRAGQSKLANWDVTLALFANEYNVPVLPVEVAALLATAVELACPVLLVLGLATRLATLPMLAMTIVIQVFVYPAAWSTHLMWAGMLLLLLTRGPGAFSLDRLIAGRFLK